MEKYVYDLECDGFLESASVIHSLVLKDIDTQEIYSYHGSTIPEGLERLKSAHTRIGHNIIKFDDAVIEKLYPELHLDPHAAIDTLVLSRLLFSNIGEQDVANRYPPEVVGSHSLDAWGHRLGCHKTKYTAGFDEWSEEMQRYCEQDVEVNYKLYKKLTAIEYSDKAIDLEHQLAVLIAKTERNGFPFDTKAAEALYATLAGERATIKSGLQSLFPEWQVFDKTIVPKRDNKKLGYKAGVPVHKYKTLTFNPASRQHIAFNLTKKYGWQPKDFTETGQAKVDETILSRLPYPEAKTLGRYMMLEKRIGQLAEGDNAWLKLERNGSIHCNYNTNGAGTGRSTCSNPNMQQVPAANERTPFGKECRELFKVPDGWNMLGADMSGLELRCLAHYMATFDNGAYAREVVEGDIHTLNQQAAGLPTRDNAKTFIYAFLYGAGDAKIGSIVKGSSRDGKRLREAFLAKTPALAALKNHVGSASGRGYLKGLDGRHIPVRSEHSALNFLLQGAGAILCKQWLVLIDQDLKSLGLTHSWQGDYAFLAWIHDEVQIAIKPEHEEVIGNVCINAAKRTAEVFDFQCPLTAEYKVGQTWAETH